MPDAVDHLREVFGSQIEIARALGVRGSTVSMWRVNGIPAHAKLRLWQLAAERGLPLNPEMLGLPGPAKVAARKRPRPARELERV